MRNLILHNPDTGCRISAGYNADWILNLRADPDCNKTFLTPDADVDHYLRCTKYDQEAGGFALTWAARGTLHIALHMAINVRTHITSLVEFNELAVLWCLMQGWRPCAVVPDKFAHVKRWLERRHFLQNGVQMVTPQEINGEFLTSTLYTVPFNWIPHAVHQVNATWRNHDY